MISGQARSKRYIDAFLLKSFLDKVIDQEMRGKWVGVIRNSGSVKVCGDWLSVL